MRFSPRAGEEQSTSTQKSAAIPAHVLFPKKQRGRPWRGGFPAAPWEGRLSCRPPGGATFLSPPGRGGFPAALRDSRFSCRPPGQATFLSPAPDRRERQRVAKPDRPPLSPSSTPTRNRGSQTPAPSPSRSRCWSFRTVDLVTAVISPPDAATSPIPSSAAPPAAGNSRACPTIPESGGRTSGIRHR